MRTIYLIRHGKTPGNEEKRYVGSTDEPLGKAGFRELEQKKANYQKLIAPKKIYTSPMLRCMQTAELLFPAAEIEPVEDFREKDFGAFEYKNYEELSGDSRYQAFIDSGGATDFPGAEPQAEFLRRTGQAFEQCIHKLQIGQEALSTEEPLVFVLHGGTIMSILSQYAFPHREYFCWQLLPLEGFTGKIQQKSGLLQIAEIRKM
jgi:alpha-ribazole phosphatase